MTIARATEMAAWANMLGQAFVGRGGEGPWSTLHQRDLLTSTGSPSSFDATGHSITQTSAPRTTPFPLMTMASLASGILADNEWENSSIATEYSSVTLGHERADESESMDDFGSESSPLNGYDVTLGVGTVHLLIGNSLDEYASDGNIELYQNKLAVMTGDVTSEEERERLYTSRKEEPDRKQSNDISSFEHLQEWKDCTNMGWFLSTQSGHDKGAVQQSMPASQEKSEIVYHHDFEIANREGRSAI